MGRPPVDTEAVNVRMPREDLTAIDVWIDNQPEPKPSRPEAIRIALREWLTNLGLLKTPNDREGRH